MKTRKSIFLAAFIAVCGLVIAQGMGGGMGGGMGRMASSERAVREVEQLKTTLSLDAAQVTKLQAISIKFAKQDSVSMAAMMAGGGQPDMAKMQADRAATTEAKTKEYNAVLTADQQAKYKTYLAEQAARRAQGGGGMGGFGGGAPQQ
jgi:hypothetical protein